MLLSCTGLRAIARLLVLSIMLTTMAWSPARAALLTTEQAIAAEAGAEARARLDTLLARADVQAELIALGIDPTEAAARIGRLTDAEIERVVSRIDELPAGEGAIGAVLGAAIFIFLVLLITDLLGLTDVFPFVRR